MELEYKLSKINWDILGIAETRRKGEECITFKTGHVLLNQGDKDKRHVGSSNTQNMDPVYKQNANNLKLNNIHNIEN